ncbi:MAG: site-specific DNA-methyltransferase [Candidatus Omnitrophica bacterium]|nr:site-specific DNA-methyltransferase [Candidatus Omnitrophota bacterium]
MTSMQQVIEGDAREVMKTFPEKSFHLIVTSPPYNVGVNYGAYRDNLSEEEYFDFAEEWLKECYRVLVDGGRICLNIPTYNWRGRFNMYFRYYELMTLLGFMDRDTFIWVKMDGLDFAHSAKIYGTISPHNPHTKYPYELILVMQKGKDTLEGEETDLRYREFFKWSHTIWFIRPEYNRIHPAPYPEELPYRLIKMFSFVGQKVLDPFCGGGATLRACKKLKREATGIDLNPEYVEMCRRAVSK